jgi:nucleoside-diphosphate-sugar epimerase
MSINSVHRIRIDWSGASSVISRRTARAIKDKFDAISVSTPWSLIWAAGQARVGATIVEADHEVESFRSALETINRLTEQRTARGQIFLLSSAGALQASWERNSTETREEPYSRAKRRQEELLAKFSERTGHAAHALRVTNAYGPMQVHRPAKGVIQTLCECVLTGRPFTKFAASSPRRNYIYVEDVGLHIAALATDEDQHRTPQYSIRLIAGPSSHTAEDLVRLVQQIAGRDVTVRLAEDEQLQHLHRGDMHIGRFVPAPLPGSTPIEHGIRQVLKSIETRFDERAASVPLAPL